jgi:hypothetical protein
MISCGSAGIPHQCRREDCQHKIEDGVDDPWSNVSPGRDGTSPVGQCRPCDGNAETQGGYRRSRLLHRGAQLTHGLNVQRYGASEADKRGNQRGRPGREGRKGAKHGRAPGLVRSAPLMARLRGRRGGRSDYLPPPPARCGIDDRPSARRRFCLPFRDALVGLIDHVGDHLVLGDVKRVTGLHLGDLGADPLGIFAASPRRTP